MDGVVTGTAPCVVELDRIAFQRQNQRIVRDITWHIHPGEHWAILGANGAGKTTLLRILTGYEWPTQGSVAVLGRRFGHTDLRELRRHIGWVTSSIVERIPHKDTALDVVLSGLDGTMGLYHDFSQRQCEQARQTLDLLGIAQLTSRRYGVLSQGERQRVLIARALICRPALLVLDEPCAGLDPVARMHFIGDLAGLVQAQEGPTLVYVTHHIEELAPWISHVLVLKDGAIVDHGERAAVLTEQTLTEAFGAPCHIFERSGSQWLHVEPS